MHANRLAMALVVGLVIAGCKKTEEGEARRWESALRDATELAAAHPGFKKAIEQQKAAAEAAMKAAREVSDKKQRIEAMAKANRMLTSGFVGGLREADAEIKELRQRLVELAGDVGTESEKAALVQARREAERALAAVDRALRSGADSAESARAVVSTIESELELAGKVLASVSKRVSDRERETAAKDKAAADEAAAKQKAAEDAVANWTCSYCDHSNVHDATKCANCGAERSSSLAPK
jgi:colicin import membrane protein